MPDSSRLYAKVILPIKFRGDISYIIPEGMINEIVTGSIVKVNFANREYRAVVKSISNSPGDYSGRIKEIISPEADLPILDSEIKLWDWISDYYMCSIGEVYKAACPGNAFSGKGRTKKELKTKDESSHTFTLSPVQTEAFEKICEAFANNKVALLNGVTGSGKTEIYIKLAQEHMKKGLSVLYMVPEIALSRQLSIRLEKIFGDKLLIYHSKQTVTERARINGLMRNSDDPYIVLGLRSSIFLPFKNLGFVIVDEEHDSSYKQTDPAPRYNGRDTALMLARIHSANTLLGSATPSLESIYNAFSGRYSMVEIHEKYFGAESPEIEIIDTIRETKRNKMSGIFSTKVLDEISRTIDAGEQVLIFRNRRSYSPIVQCMYCGYIPKCEHCNVSLSYHKSRNELKCHYCDYHVMYNTICSKCGKPGLRDKGTGTEKIEEKIKELFPQARIERFDFETTQSKLREKKILREFAQHKLDILVGTQMISKGFDFEHLSLICLLQADSMLAIQDFRANERAIQLLTQLSGRSGRKFKKGKIIIQTSMADHPIYTNFSARTDTLPELLSERKEFEYPPFVRMIKVTLRGSDRTKLSLAADDMGKILLQCGVKDYFGPFAPVIDRFRDEYILQFWLKLTRDNTTQSIKGKIMDNTDKYLVKHHPSVKVIFDADPL